MAVSLPRIYVDMAMTGHYSRVSVPLSRIRLAQVSIWLALVNTELALLSTELALVSKELALVSAELALVSTRLSVAGACTHGWLLSTGCGVAYIALHYIPTCLLLS